MSDKIIFDKIVKKLSKSVGKIITIEDILAAYSPQDRSLLSKMRKGKEAQKMPASVYKTIYRLRAMGWLLPIKNGIYFIQDPAFPRELSHVLAGEYWQIVRRVCDHFGPIQPIITGRKAMELHLKDLSTPEEILFYSDLPSSRLALHANATIRFIQPKNAKWAIALSRFVRFSERANIEWADFKVACVELALLEALLNHGKNTSLDKTLLGRFLTRFGATLSREIMGQLVEFRYISAINRLREFAKATKNDRIYTLCLDVIKKEGAGCFISTDVSDLL